MVRVMRLTGAMAVAIVLLKHAEAGSMRAAGGYSAPAPGPGDVDCVLGEWVLKHDCDPKTLVQVFEREVLTKPEGKGRKCDRTIEKRQCLPVHCQMGPWSDWSVCDESGYKQRTREIEVSPKLGGRSCPSSTQRVKCRSEDCVMCAWSEWVCDEYTGIQTRRRHVTRPARDGGAPCPSDYEEKPCNPVPCVLGYGYGDWSDCDESGTRHKTQNIMTPAKFGGTCDPDVKSELCPFPCKRNTVDEETTNEWSKCVEQYDGTWVRSKELGIKTPAENGGTCPPETATETCEPVPCKRNTVDEETTNEWSKCVEQYDGTWMRSKELGIKTPAENGGTCPPETATETCEPVPCKRNTVDEETTNEWSKCVEQYDGTWVRSKELGIKTPAENGGTCPPETATETCKPVDCVMEGEFGKCEKKGHKWFKTKVLKVKVYPENGGKQCPPKDDCTITEECEKVDCVVSDFGPWGPCTKNWRKRTREVTQQPMYGGKACPKLEEKERCSDYVL